jgi:hypothetical protein
VRVVYEILDRLIDVLEVVSELVVHDGLIEAEVESLVGFE